MRDTLPQRLAILSLILTGTIIAPLRAHEQPTHTAITARALDYLRSSDPVRYGLLVQQYGAAPLLVALEDGSWNEDNYFVGAGCGLFNPVLNGNGVPCYLGRFYFHFLHNFNDPLNDLGQLATCSSVDWAMGTGTCTAITSAPFSASYPILNNHTWQMALSSVSAAKSPTLTGWTHLSYLIHLLEDLTSPPHTRNSGHPCVGWLAFCDPFEPGNENTPVGMPISKYLDFSNVVAPEDIFRKVQAYTHDNYFSARTVFNGEGPSLGLSFDDVDYFYTTDCLPASRDVGTCVSVNGRSGRKIAYKGLAYSQSVDIGAADPTKATINDVIAREQFLELGPVAAQSVAALIKFYAPMLTVSIGGNGHGTVSSNSGTLNCENANTPCGILLAQTTSGPPSAVLTATATSDSVFTSWSGDCSGTATSATVSLIGDKTCTANFTLKPKLTMTISGSGSVVSSPAGINCGTTCVAPFLPNSQVTLTATPASGATFSGWSGACSGTSTSVTLTMSSDKTCTASFTPSRFSLVVTWTVSPTVANGWSGTKTLTVTNQNWTYTGTLTNANNGCAVMRSESSSGQMSIPVAPNPPASFSFPVNPSYTWTNAFCNHTEGGSGAPAGLVTIVATPAAGGGFTLSTNTTYAPGDYYGGAQMTVTASGFLN